MLYSRPIRYTKGSTPSPVMETVLSHCRSSNSESSHGPAPTVFWQDSPSIVRWSVVSAVTVMTGTIGWRRTEKNGTIEKQLWNICSKAALLILPFSSENPSVSLSVLCAVLSCLPRFCKIPWYPSGQCRTARRF